MKLELSHDILAREIHESMTRSAPELVQLKQKEQYIRAQYAYYREGARSYLTREELDELAPFLRMVDVSGEERQFLLDSQAAMRRRRRSRNALIAAIGLVIAATLTGVLYYAYRAQLSEVRADEASAYSESVRLSTLAQQEITRGNRHNALLLARHGAKAQTPPLPLLQNALTDAFHLGFQNIPLLIAKLPHGGAVKQMRFAPDGRRILSVSTDRTARLWDVNGALLAQLTHDGQIIHDAIFSPDGRTIFTTAADGSTHAWDATGRRVRSLNLGGESVLLGATDTHLLAIDYDRTVRLYHLATDSLIVLSGPPPQDHWWAVHFSPDGSQILLADPEGKMTLFDLAGRTLRQGQFPWDTDTQRYTFRFLKNGDIRITTPNPNQGWTWQATGQISSTPSRPFLSNGTLLPPTDNLVEVSYRDRHPVLGIPLPKAIGFKYPLTDPDATFSPTGAHIASSVLGADSLLFIWTLNSDPIKAILLSQTETTEVSDNFPVSPPDTALHRFPIDEIRWSPAGNRLFTASSYQSKLWSADLDLVASWPTRSGNQQIRFTEDGTLLWMTFAMGDGSEELSVRDTFGTELLRLHFPDDRINEVAPTRDARQIAILLNNGRIACYSLDEQRIVRQIESGGSPTTGLFNRRGDQLFIGFGDGAVKEWTIAGDSIRQLTKHANNVFDLDLDEDGGLLLSASGDGFARLSTTTGKRIRDIKMSGFVEEVAFSPSGEHYFARDQNHQLVLLSASGTDSLVLSAVNLIVAAHFSPDGAQLLLEEQQTAAKQQLRLVDLRGQTLAVYPHPGIITSMAISAGGRQIRSSGASAAWVFLTPAGVLDWLQARPLAPFSEQEKRLYQIAGDGQ